MYHEKLVFNVVRKVNFLCKYQNIYLILNTKKLIVNGVLISTVGVIQNKQFEVRNDSDSLLNSGDLTQSQCVNVIVSSTSIKILK
jgi:hypothetical protein